MGSARIAFIVNPNSAGGLTAGKWPEIRAGARSRFGRIDSFITGGPGDATSLTREAIASGADIIVCMGGDGTLNETINGFMGGKGPLRQGTLLAFIPSGTGCDFARSVPVQRDAVRSFEDIRVRRHRVIDLGRLSYTKNGGGTGSRYFHNVVSFGLGGEVDLRVKGSGKALGGSVSFIWATLASLLSYKKKVIRIAVDDIFDEQVRCWNVAVANGQYHGGGMWIAPGAEVEDGSFQLTIIGDLSMRQIFLNLHRLYNGSIYKQEMVQMVRGRRITAVSDKRVLIDMDGEQCGRLPAVVEVVPSVLPIICSD